MTHEAFKSVKGQDGQWRALCMDERCGWVGPARDHVLDTGPDCVGHMEQTSGAPA